MKKGNTVPRVTLSFKIPEEQEEFDTTMKAGSYHSVLWSLDQEFFRQNIKYGLNPEVKRKVIEEVQDKETQDKLAAMDQEVLNTLIESVLDVCRSKLHETCSDYDISL